MDLSLPVPCPNCDEETERSLSEIREGCRITCPKCGAVTEITGTGANEIQREFDNLDAQIDRINRGMK